MLEFGARLGTAFIDDVTGLIFTVKKTTLPPVKKSPAAREMKRFQTVQRAHALLQQPSAPALVAGLSIARDYERGAA
jgi:hypothetical protein